MGAAALIMAFSVLLSRFMGLFRDNIISWQFGAGGEADIYFAAFVVPDFLNYLLAGGYVSITLIPLLSRRFDCDFINLGFSGSCRGEQEIVDYMASLDMSVFVCDFDHNRSSAEKLESAHFNVYETIRKKHPDIPFYMISRPDFRFDKMDFDRRAVIMESYLRAWRAGDENVYFWDGTAEFAPYEEWGTVEGCHPNDVGFLGMAKSLEKIFEVILSKEKNNGK